MDTAMADHSRGFRENVAVLVAQIRSRLSPFNRKKQSVLIDPRQCPHCFHRSGRIIYGRHTYSNGRFYGKASARCSRDECGKIYTWKGAQK